MIKSARLSFMLLVLPRRVRRIGWMSRTADSQFDEMERRLCQALPMQKKGAAVARDALLQLTVDLPEEVVDDVDDFTGPGVDQDRVVIVADPPRARRCVRQAVVPRIVDPEPAALIARPHPPA